MIMKKKYHEVDIASMLRLVGRNLVSAPYVVILQSSPELLRVANNKSSSDVAMTAQLIAEVTQRVVL